MSNRHEFANCIDIVYEILTNVQKCTALLLLMLLFKLAILVKKIHFRGVRGGLLWAILAQNMPPGLVDTGKNKICCHMKNYLVAAILVNLIFC